MKHLEETINQYHLQSEKNLEGTEQIKCGFKNTRTIYGSHFTMQNIQRYSASDQIFFTL